VGGVPQVRVSWSEAVSGFTANQVGPRLLNFKFLLKSLLNCRNVLKSVLNVKHPVEIPLPGGAGRRGRQAVALAHGGARQNIHRHRDPHRQRPRDGACSLTEQRQGSE
jgi:hypothetical protein